MAAKLNPLAEDLNRRLESAAPEVAAMAGLEIPSIAGEHTHILFEAIDVVDNRDSYLPLVRDPDRSIYIRQEMDSLILGLYESKVKQWNPKGVPWDYAQTELQPDIDHIAEFIEQFIFLLPGRVHQAPRPICLLNQINPLLDFREIVRVIVAGAQRAKTMTGKELHALGTRFATPYRDVQVAGDMIP